MMMMMAIPPAYLAIGPPSEELQCAITIKIIGHHGPQGVLALEAPATLETLVRTCVGGWMVA